MSTVEEKLEIWKHELLDLSNRNRLVNFSTSVKSPRSIQLVAPDMASVFDQIVSSRRQIRLIPQPEPPEDEIPYEDQEDGELTQPEPERSRIAKAVPLVLDAPAGHARTQLDTKRTITVAQRLIKQNRTSLAEQGIGILFAVFGVLKWQEGRPDASRPSFEFRRSPAIIVPIELKESAHTETFAISCPDGEAEINATLVQKLSHSFGITLSQLSEDPTSLNSLLQSLREVADGRDGWELLDEVHLCTLNFHKMRMFQDLEDHLAILSENEVIRSLADDSISLGNSIDDAFPDERDVDRLATPKETFTPLDADSSQLRAVLAARSGRHLLIEGPPGTGKSQTITNIIAECIASGRSVLFVSEKAAALDVVYRRLEALKLDRYCLMLHSSTTTKRDVIHELGRRLEEGGKAAVPRDDTELESLAKRRLALNQFVEALHKRRAPFNESLFWMNGQLASLAEFPLISFPPTSLESASFSMFADWDDQLDRLANYIAVINAGASHPWYGIRSSRPSLAAKANLSEALATLSESIDVIDQSAALLSYHLGLPKPVTIAESKALAELSHLIVGERSFTPKELGTEENKELLQLSIEAHSRSTTLRDDQNALSNVASLQLVDAPLDTFKAVISSAGSFTLFNSSYRSSISQIQDYLIDKKRKDRSLLLSHIDSALQVRSNREWFKINHAKLSEVAGVPVDEALMVHPEAWQLASDHLNLARQIASKLASPPDNRFIEAVNRSDPGAPLAAQLARLTTAYATAQQSATTISELYPDMDWQLGGHSWDTVPCDQLLIWAQTHQGLLDEIDNFVDSQNAIAGAEQSGLGDLFSQLISRNVPPGFWSKTVRKAVYTAWVDQLTDADPDLRFFRGLDLNQARGQFAALDKSVIASSARRVDARAAARMRGYASAVAGEPQILRSEYNKQRRHMSLRRLFGRIPNLLPILKPCLMMSPLSVAQYLPADRLSFDVVIFDEASQVRPVDALGAIMRGKQLIVAGDSRQLPPTSFFESATTDFPEDDEVQDITMMESILDGIRSRNVASSSLLWHYRSRHEDLISFSNRNIYDGRLVTFPTPDADRTPLRGVRLEYVEEGVYDLAPSSNGSGAHRVNLPEARRVADLIMHHAQTRQHESLGVVAFGVHQADEIENALGAIRQLDSRFESFFESSTLEPFFVKPLEQVQGDERDVMIICVGFARNPHGTLSHNFGPLNREGGERRLNVLITRAKHQIIVVSSIRGDDIDPTRTHARGPQLLKQYLDFAERGPIALIAARQFDGEADYESPFEEEVANAIRRLGYDVHSQVGTSRYRIDLAVVDPKTPGRYVLGVECDGATYHSSKSARDRDRLRQEVLEGLGWRLYRIWSTDWVQRRDTEISALRSAIELAIAESETDEISHPEPEAPEEAFHDNETSVDEAALPIVEISALPDYTRARLRFGSVGDILDSPLGTLADAMKQCTEIESPVHKDVLFQRLLETTGMQRRGARLTSRLEQGLAAAVKAQMVNQRGAFVWSIDGRPVVPRSAIRGVTRSIEEVAPEEIAAVVLAVVQESLSVDERQLIQQTARKFGFQRTGVAIDQSIRSVLSSLLASGNLVYENHLFSLADS